MLKLSGLAAPADTCILATIADATRLLVWLKTRDGRRGKNPPESLLEKITGINKKDEPGEGFDTPEDFMAWREKMLGGEGRG